MKINLRFGRVPRHHLKGAECESYDELKQGFQTDIIKDRSELPVARPSTAPSIRDHAGAS